MARSLATVEAEIDALRAAIARGVLRVRHGDTETTYQSIEGMLKALDALLAEANGLGENPVRQVRFQTSKGLD